MNKIKQSANILYGLIVIVVAVVLGGYLLYEDQLTELYGGEVEPGEEIEEVEEVDEDKEAPADDEAIDDEATDDEEPEEKDEPADDEDPSEDEEPADEGIEISEMFPGKIVYTTSTSQDTAKYEADCEERGGTFNECGTVCAPDADFCVMVCAFTCEDIPYDNENDQAEEPGLETYSSENLGISFSFPSDMEVEKHNDWVRVYKWGPTQMENTEFYDGIVVLFRKEDNPDNLELEAYAEQVLQNELELNGEVISPVTKISYGQLVGYEFTILSLGESSSFFFENDAGEVVRIAHSVEDPEDQDFNTILIQILQSLKNL